ncbi:MAG: HPr family phosphocarrier protein [Lachnospiraceae bacterium]|nr:HPr family phosphocarrier protein [Lachnospiraceae bacterium]
MEKKTVIVQKRNGLEARPIAKLVQIASQCASEVQIHKGNRWVNAKSLLGMMTLDIIAGEEIQIVTSGQDEQTAMENLCNYLQAEM